MLSPEYYSKLDPSYHEILHKLDAERKEPRSEQAENALRNFMAKYMIPQELWNLSPKYFPSFDNNNLAYRFLPFGNDRVAYNSKYYDKQMTLCHSSVDILFPYKYLTEKMEQYEKQIYSFIPQDIRQRHEEMKALYLKIKEAEDDIDQWFDALVEAKDHQFVCDNVEYRLGSDLTDKKLWKRYIKYLKKIDFKILLETFSKYCRFFTDDFEMMEEYRRAAVKYNGHVLVPWKNPYKFEVYDNKCFFIESGKFGVPANTTPLTIHFDAINPAKPDFPFLSPTIRYIPFLSPTIRHNASGEVLRKLFKTCKWFRAAHPINVCYKFEENGYGQNQPIEIKEQSIKSVNNSILHSNLDQLFISTVFRYYSDNPNTLSNLIPRIYRCTAKYANIHNQHLSLEELKFFIGNAIHLNLSNVKDSDGNEFKLESILQLTPKMKRLSLRPVECSAETCQKLCELEFESKFESIDISGIKSNLFDPLKFAEFIKKNCSSKAFISISVFREDRSEEYVERFRQVLCDAINENWTGDEKPSLEIFITPIV